MSFNIVHCQGIPLMVPGSCPGSYTSLLMYVVALHITYTYNITGIYISQSQWSDTSKEFTVL